MVKNKFVEKMRDLIIIKDNSIVKRVKKVRDGKSAGPYIAQIHLTNKCNYKCVFCPTRTFISKKELETTNELSLSEWLDIIDQGNKLKIEEWHICGGGEPLLFKNKALKLMVKIKKSKKRGEIITNGYFFDEDFIKTLVKYQWDKITFSIDAPNAELYAKIRGLNTFKKIEENLSLFKKYKKNKKNPRIAIHFVVCNLNYKEIPTMIKFCERYNIDDFLINALNTWSEKIEKYALSVDEQKELIEILKSSEILAKKKGISTNFNDFLNNNLFDKANHMNEIIENEKTPNKKIIALPDLKNAPCFSPWFNISIFADGRVLPCFILKHKGISIRKKSLKEIWYSNFFNEIRKQMLLGKVHKSCAKCNPWSYSKTQEIKNKL